MCIRDSHIVAVQRFCYLQQEIRAVPKVHIAYLREAYVSDNDEVRVTLDRSVCAEPNLDLHVTTKMAAPVRAYPKLVILELKFTNRFPDWFRELVRVCNAVQCGAAKYVESIQGLGSRRLRAFTPVVEEPVRFARIN